ncbi:MAG: hypothetical protein AB7O24_00845 [Kofleriaceae bacterium]
MWIRRGPPAGARSPGLAGLAGDFDSALVFDHDVSNAAVTQHAV